MVTKRVKIQNQTKLFCVTRYQNSDFLPAWGINNQNTAQDSFWGFDNNFSVMITQFYVHTVKIH